MAKVLETVVSFGGALDPSLGKTLGAVSKSISGLNLKSIAIGAAVSASALGAAKAASSAAKALYSLGDKFNSAQKAIRIGTGATGAALEALQGDFQAVYASVPTSAENAAKAIADYNTRLGLSGPELQSISKQAIQAASLLGEDLNGVIEGSSKAFQQFGLESAEMGAAMDHAFKVSQSFGIGFGSLMNKVKEYGPNLQKLGYSFDSAAVMVGKLEKAGFRTEEVINGLKKANAVFMASGKDSKTGFADYYAAIRGAGSEAEASKIALELFGAEAGTAMTRAIRSGALSIGDLTAEIQANKETIGGAAEDTYTFSERMQMLGQKMEVVFAPLAKSVFGTLEKLTPIFEQIADVFSKAIGEVMPVLQGTISELMPVISGIIESTLPAIKGLIQSILPPLANLVKSLLPPIVKIVGSLFPIISNLANALLPAIVSIVSALLPALEPILGILASIIEKVVIPILPMLTGLIQSILPPIIDLISSLSGILGPFLGILSEIHLSVVGPMIPILTAIAQAVLPAIIAVLKVLFKVATPIFELFQKAMPFISAFAEKISEVVKIGGDLLGPLLGKFSGLFGEESSVLAGLPKRAAGGWTEGITIAGEAGPEMVLSMNPAHRAQNVAYWIEAGNALGAIGGGNSSAYDFSGLVFSPQIMIQEGDQGTIIDKLKDFSSEFTDLILSCLERREGGRYGR